MSRLEKLRIKLSGDELAYRLRAGHEAKFFPEYAVFSQTAGAKFKAVSPDEEMGISFENLQKCLNRSVKAIIINSPNNPSGVVFDKETIKKLAAVLKEKEVEYGHPIYLITDEPYRELSYGVEVPYVPSFYDDTIVCYSYSKALSVPGDRIGYIAVSPKAADSGNVYFAICGAGRALGYVCAPSIMQKVIADCVYDTSDIEKYKENRDVLCNGLKEMGYEFAKPDGAFYLFVKSPSGDGNEFSERAKKHEVLIVSSAGFGVATHARISYCVDKKTIVLPEADDERTILAAAEILREDEEDEYQAVVKELNDNYDEYKGFWIDGWFWCNAIELYK